MTTIEVQQAEAHPLSHAEIKRQFDDLAAYCAALAQEKRLRSGLEFYVDADRRLAVRALSPKLAEGEAPPDLARLMRTGLSAYQTLRHGTAKLFDVDSAQWNRSNIGTMLNVIEKGLRTQTYNVEAASSATDAQPYNALEIIFLTEAAIEFYRWLLSREFTRLWRWQRLRAVNEKAGEFLVRDHRRHVLQAMSMMAQLVIALDDLLKVRDEPPVRRLANTFITSGMATQLQQYFGEIGRA